MSETGKKVADLLKALSDQEKELMIRALKIERDWLWTEKPRVREELLKAVREVIK